MRTTSAPAPNRLVIFDVDGTLTDTNAVDDECYWQAVGEVLGMDCVGIDWSGASDVTDVALIHWVRSTRRGPAPTAAEIEQVRSRFLELLMEARARAPQRFSAIAGAAGLVEHLHHHGWGVAIATGGWSASARLKLETAGVAISGCPLASADDGLSRGDIVRSALALAESRSSRPLSHVVSVGDGAWDVRTAIELSLPFVGVGHDTRAARLRAAGAGVVLDDLRDWPAVLDAFASARVPRTPGTVLP